MGKIFSKNYIALTICLIIALFNFAGAGNLNAAMQEGELFEKAYNYYLSYQPGKAIDFFDIFLLEYPASSSRDAALFWKARSLVQTNKKDEAISILRGLIEEFPSSHFRGFAELELDNISRADIYGTTIRPSVNSRGTAISSDNLPENNKSKIREMPFDDIKQKKELDEYQKKLQLSEKAVSIAVGEKNICLESLEDEKKKNEDCKTFESSLKACDTNIKAFSVEKQENEKMLDRLSKERDYLAEQLKSAEIHEKELKDSLLSLQKKQESQKDTPCIESKNNKDSSYPDNTTKNLQDEISALSNKLKQFDVPIMKIAGKQYTAVQIIDEYLSASEVENKLKQKTISWKKKNVYDDFLMEQLLLNKARELKIKEDMALYNMLVKQYSFTENEKAYLSRYLTIDKLLSKVSGNIIILETDLRKYYEKNKHEFLVSPGEKVINVLSVDYTAENELERNLLTIEIQNKAANGHSLENIHEKQPDLIFLKQYAFNLSPDWIKEEASKLKEGEISNIISKDNKYIIIQTWKSMPVYEKYEDVRYVIREKLLGENRSNNQVLNNWLKEIRNEDGKTAGTSSTNISLQTNKKPVKPQNKSIALKKKSSKKTKKPVLRKKP